MTSPTLKPRTSRVALFYFGFFFAVLAPTIIGLLIGFFGPPVYVLDHEVLQSGWADEVREQGEAVVETKIFATSEAARERARRYVDGVAESGYVKTVNEYRFVDEKTGKEVLVFALETVLIRIEGQDRVQVDEALGGLPFLVENPRQNIMHMLLTEHIDWLFAGLAIYIVLLTLLLFRGGAWAATIQASEHLQPVPAATLRQRLLELNRLDSPMQIGEDPKRRLVAEWRFADVKWRTLFAQSGLRMAHSLEMELDSESSTVRTVDISRALSWRAGLPQASFNLSYFRGIKFYQAEAGASYGLLRTPEGWRFDEAYRYRYSLDELKHPVMAAIIESGWSVRPVITFFEPLGG